MVYDSWAFLERDEKEAFEERTVANLASLRG